MNFPLVTTDWLAENLTRKNLVLLDASMAKVIGREPIVYDEPVFIPGARKFDLEADFCDLDSPMVHAFPTEEQFTREAQKLGINADSIVIIYDNQGVYSSPRAWWMFQSMGHENTFVWTAAYPNGWWSKERRFPAWRRNRPSQEISEACCTRALCAIPAILCENWKQIR